MTGIISFSFLCVPMYACPLEKGSKNMILHVLGEVWPSRTSPSFIHPHTTSRREGEGEWENGWAMRRLTIILCERWWYDGMVVRWYDGMQKGSIDCLSVNPSPLPKEKGTLITIAMILDSIHSSTGYANFVCPPC